MEQAAGPLALIGLMLLGIAVLWARQVAYRTRAAHHQDAVRLVLSIAGSLLILVGLLGGTTHMMFVLAPVGAVFILGVVMMLVLRFRALERRTLLQCISVAAAKGIPLHHAVRSFANERTDELGYRAAILAEALEAGMSLPDALRYSKTRLPTDALLAMRLGHETGALGPAVSRVAKHDDNLSLVARSIFEKYLYLGAMVVMITVAVSFYMLYLVPVFEKMFREFELSLPPLTQMNIRFANFFGENYLLFLPIEGLLVVLLLVSGLQYAGLMVGDVPGFGFLTLRLDSALIMRALALAISYDWPLNKTVWLLARIYPKRGIRRRLAVAGKQIDNGVPWCDALRDAGIVGRADWAVLTAAQQVGNIEWALDEMADSSARRLMYRSRLFLNVAFPITLLAFGMFIGFFVVGFFVPLVSLIQGMA